MKARVIQSKIWTDEYFFSLSLEEKIVFLYLITNESINIIHLYQITPQRIAADTGVSVDKVLKTLQKFNNDKKIFFFKNHVFLKNAYKYQDYKGKKNEEAKKRLLSELPKDVLDWYKAILDRGIDTTIDRGIDTLYNKKLEINNKKLEIINNNRNREIIREKEKEKEKIDINKFIAMFKNVNPSYERLFSNKTQRASIERLLKKYGEAWLRSLINRLPDIIKMPYAPQITTPYELEMKLGKLKIFLEQEKNKVQEKGLLQL